MATINGTGTIVTRRAHFWGTGFVISGPGATRTATVTQPLDEAKTGVFPVNCPGGTFAGPGIPASVTNSTL